MGASMCSTVVKYGACLANRAQRFVDGGIIWTFTVSSADRNKSFFVSFLASEAKSILLQGQFFKGTLISIFMSLKSTSNHHHEQQGGTYKVGRRLNN